MHVSIFIEGVEALIIRSTAVSLVVESEPEQGTLFSSTDQRAFEKKHEPQAREVFAEGKSNNVYYLVVPLKNIAQVSQAIEDRRGRG